MIVDFGWIWIDASAIAFVQKVSSRLIWVGYKGVAGGNGHYRIQDFKFDSEASANDFYDKLRDAAKGTNDESSS